MAEAFTGEVRIWALGFAPRDWAFCNGQLVDISQNPALFSILGTMYGGNGRTDFGLPDLRGRAAMHEGSGPGLTPRPLTEKLGTEGEGLSVAQMPNHTHDMRCQSGNANAQNPSGNYLASELGPATPYSSAGANETMAAGAILSSGGGQEHENMQPFLTMNFCICLSGIFPQRS